MNETTNNNDDMPRIFQNQMPNCNQLNENGGGRTPKRRHADERTPEADNQQSSDDEADARTQDTTKQRIKVQRGDTNVNIQDQNDVIQITDEVNNGQQKDDTQRNRRTTNTRTYTNTEWTNVNHARIRKEKKKSETINDKSNIYRSQPSDHSNDQQSGVYISNHALHYAVEQHLPSINIKCKPIIENQKQATDLIKDFFAKIEQNFKNLNKKYTKPLGFDYWYIDKNGDLQCYTKEIELFVFLCDGHNYPGKISNTEITPNPPKRLPPQRSIILKYIPYEIPIEDVKEEIIKYFKSVFKIEEMKGLANGKHRHIRVDLSNQDDYIQILKDGVVGVNGQLVEVAEFLAPPRILICSKCGKNKKEDTHTDCTIKCHHCDGQHEATSYNCPIISNFRRELINKLKSKPDLLPQNIQLFIPTEYRQRGETNNRMLTNNICNNQISNQKEVRDLLPNTNDFPILPSTSKGQPRNKWTSQSQPVNNNNDIWIEMNKSKQKLDEIKMKFEILETNLNNKFNDYKFKIGSIVSIISVQVEQQNEVLKTIFSALNGITSTAALLLDQCQKLVTKTLTNSNDQHERCSLETNLQQTQTQMQFLNEQRYTGLSQQGTNSYGGVAILYQNLLKCTVKEKALNFILIELEATSEAILIGAVYVPPGTLPPFQLFNSCKDKPFYIFGDFNAKHTTWGCSPNNPSGIHLFDWLEATGNDLIMPDKPTSRRSDAKIDFCISHDAAGWLTEINVTLNGDKFSDPTIIADDLPFKSILIYVNSEGVSVDLLQLYGAQTHMGRYVALVMDKLFTLEEITTIIKDELVKDERYLIIEEAVRSRFKLNHEMLRSSTGNVTVQPAPQVALHDDFDEFIGSFAN
ncbi:unnamed protein product [Adineta steineri]|uniref:Endonuclease/exonuclease/phosphatase domain-containing protein n=1 Tax=Adineta steineri TaxID=433720 RepID=A0A814S598_9BILA|nr:unnamed protein product [Adineta steineri]